VVVNPLAVWVSPGRRRLPALAAVLVGSGFVIAAVPFVPLRHTLAVLCAFQTCQLSSYAISDAAMLERVPPALRGRVVGLFLTIAGTFASTSPWVMGFWTDGFGDRAADPLTYVGPYATLGAMMALAAGSIYFIARLGKPDQPRVEPITEVTPGTLEPVG
jgi:MFS family permease